MPSPLASMLAQAQMSGTSPTPFRATVAPTDVEKAYNDYNNTMMQAYQGKLGQQNAMWGGLAGLGGAGIMTLPKLLGGGGTAGLGSSVDLAGIPDALASGIAPEDLLASLALV